MMTSNTGVIVARFQTPYLHEGHIDLVNRTLDKHNKVIIILGTTSILGSRRNPFDFHTREKMVKDAFSEVVVLPLGDNPSDYIWSQSLDRLLAETFPSENFILYGSRDSFINHYHGKLPVTELEQKGNYNATEIREALADKVQRSQDFRSGILYAYHNTYPKVYPTVDIALFRNEKKEILLGKKHISKHWRLPGGFVDPEDDDFEIAAKRELREECGLIEVAGMAYEKTFKIDDWRYRNEVDKIITTVFSCNYMYGNVEAMDDIAEVGWFKTDDLDKMINANEITPEHLQIFSYLIKKYASK